MTDREKREKTIKGLECCMLSYKDGCDECPYIGKGMCQELLGEHAIALLKAQEPKRGQWMTDGDRLYCSSCEGTQINEVVLNGKQIYFLDIGEQMKYCGKCGARMDGERE